MKIAAIVLSIIALIVFVVGPAIFIASGRPVFMQCEGLTTMTCEEALSYRSDELESGGESRPIFSFYLKSWTGSGTCADVDILFWPPIDGVTIRPLC